MNEQMEFPETFEKFAEEYGFKDDKEVYTNGSDLIPIFRVKQWLEHDKKLRIIETDTAYECGKHANKWIPVSKRLPKKEKDKYKDFYKCLVAVKYTSQHNICDTITAYFNGKHFYNHRYNKCFIEGVKAWMPLPESYKAESEEDKG